ncbi:MAG: hypothetical protein ACE5GO_04590, partial [Anaerolineales bacterium]
DLTEMGFYLARCSQSNYARTRSSLSSSLNLTYIPALNPHYHSGNNTIAGFDKLIKHSAIRKHLESLGYTTIAFETGFYWSEIHDAGIYLAPSRPPDGQPAVHNPSDFEIMLLDTSLGMLLLEGELPFPWQQQFSKEYNHRNRVLFTLDQLPALPAVPGPKFVFAHIVSPHRPLVFGPNGEMAGENQRFGYVDQVAYLNQRVIPILREIIEASSPAPIILLQSDHAAPFISPEDRMTILNAYLLPNGGDANLYPTISPVNSFRVVFNHYFGGGLDLLEDVSYYSKATEPFDYTVIPNTRPGCKNQ